MHQFGNILNFLSINEADFQQQIDPLSIIQEGIKLDHIQNMVKEMLTKQGDLQNANLLNIHFQDHYFELSMAVSKDKLFRLLIKSKKTLIIQKC